MLRSVSTLLEILRRPPRRCQAPAIQSTVSTLLEILPRRAIEPRAVLMMSTFQPFLRFYDATDRSRRREDLRVSTLLEILPLVWLVVVGF